KPKKQKVVPPRLVVKTDREFAPAAVPALNANQLIAFRYHAIDFKTQPLRRYYRTAVVPGHVTTAPHKTDQAWQLPTLNTQFNWNPEGPGDYTFFVQFIDRDLNYSEPARAELRIVTPWYESMALMIPTSAGILGLVGWAFVARTLYVRKRREAERL